MAIISWKCCFIIYKQYSYILVSLVLRKVYHIFALSTFHCSNSHKVPHENVDILFKGQLTFMVISNKRNIRPFYRTRANKTPWQVVCYQIDTFPRLGVFHCQWLKPINKHKKDQIIYINITEFQEAILTFVQLNQRTFRTRYLPLIIASKGTA